MYIVYVELIDGFYDVEVCEDYISAIRFSNFTSKRKDVKYTYIFSRIE